MPRKITQIMIYKSDVGNMCVFRSYSSNYYRTNVAEETANMTLFCREGYSNIDGCTYADIGVCHSGYGLYMECQSKY